MSAEALKTLPPILDIEEITTTLHDADLNDLCDATEAAITDGGGFGWIDIPPRETLERYWPGVITMPARKLLVARLDHVICGAAQLVFPPKNNQAQAHSVHLTGLFLAPWARGFGLARQLLRFAEETALKNQMKVVNLDVRETQSAAISLYESEGYVQIGSHPYYAEVDGEAVPGRYYYKLIAV